ncbi:MAG: dockerin type I repeat-containing protein, partial [Muribaculaceae bacterium]|nr:dockerin type I repeat-containing protein [Muribaculaceae bacterium]
EIGIPGDVDGDGVVTAADVTALYDILLGDESAATEAGDVDGDGNITSADITAIYNILLGQ